MNENIKQLMAERFEELPKGLQRAVTDSNLPAKLGFISKKYRLHIDQASSMETEIMLVMLGLEPASSFVGNLSRSLRIDVPTARAIAEESDKEIFAPIKKLLMEMDLKRREEEDELEIKTAPENPIEEDPVPPATTSETPLKKEDILKGIEEPEPALSKQVRFPTEPVVGMKVNLPTSDLQKAVEKLTMSMGPSIRPKPTNPTTTGNKLNQIVTAPKKEIHLSEEKKESQKSNYSSTDPYREPIN